MEMIAVPPPVDGLDRVPEPLAAAMRRRGIEALTSVQRAVLEADSAGCDLRVSSQTGSGKTVAIGLALARHDAFAGTGAGPTVLVLVPTRELAMQVRDELGWLYGGLRGVRVEVVMGGTSLGLERRALQKEPTIVVGTPGRVLDHLGAGAFSTAGIAHVVLDEADRMLDMGFREELEAILEALPEERRTHLVSATFPAAVRTLADRFQRNPLHVEGTELGAANVDIEHTAHLVDRRETYAALVNLLLLNEGERCLIFVERRVDATELAEKLSADGFPVQAFSGELPQAQRTSTLAAFRDGTIKTLVSTDVAARGIDVPDIGLVIHAELPVDSDTYVHRSGRTGRAGRTGRSVLLVPPRSRGRVERILSSKRIAAEWEPVPSPSVVRKKRLKRFRRELYRRFQTEETTPKQLEYAKSLLEGRDPVEVVARLLDMAEPVPPRDPAEVREPAPSRSAPGCVKFTINWGTRNGATPERLLGHVCRRGRISSRDVGAIELGDREATFEIDARVAFRFEKLVRRRDSRDPHLRIVRVGAPRGRRPYSRGRRGKEQPAPRG